MEVKCRHIAHWEVADSTLAIQLLNAPEFGDKGNATVPEDSGSPWRGVSTSCTTWKIQATDKEQLSHNWSDTDLPSFARFYTYALTSTKGLDHEWPKVFGGATEERRKSLGNVWQSLKFMNSAVASTESHVVSDVIKRNAGSFLRALRHVMAVREALGDSHDASKIRLVQRAWDVAVKHTDMLINSYKKKIEELRQLGASWGITILPLETSVKSSLLRAVCPACSKVVYLGVDGKLYLDDPRDRGIIPHNFCDGTDFFTGTSRDM